MRILVGIMYTMENELEECLDAIDGQSYRNFDRFIVEGLPFQLAHETLYGTFMEQAREFDLFIKVDADMVIENLHLFSGIVSRFRENDWMDELSIPVHDFFSEQLIPAMHTYRNSVIWQKHDDELFSDKSQVPRHRQMLDTGELAPAAIHCKNPSAFQSFHYGFYRALKITQPNLTLNRGKSKEQWDNIERTWRNFQKRKDVRLGFAVLGAELMLQGEYEIGHLNYNDPLALEVFGKYESYDAGQIEAEIRDLRGQNLGFLPSGIRRELISNRTAHPLGLLVKGTVVDGIELLRTNRYYRAIRRRLGKRTERSLNRGVW